ncbi:MAG: bifunctional folylpolyglutamate synthase/dihydrofolate synthase [Alistipes sp.]|nr:bifunctional folylpolyglutamate synthase/dihydrofolate synthase [Alistipes sp.]
MNYTQTLEFLFQALPAYETKGATAYKPGLERIAAFCRHMGNPQRNFFTVHVAGTNGKGSVSHIVASVLQQAGYRTGLFTSPHLLDFRERIRVDGEMIPKQKVVNFVDKHRDKMVELDLSFFEMTAAMAFDFFAQSDVEVAVIETGLGGRLDATNIIVPIVSVITNVGLEHTDLLGDTLPKIAAEKAGIVKKSIPVVIGESDPRYNAAIEQAAAANKSKVIYAEQIFQCEEQRSKENGQQFRLRRMRDSRAYDIDLDLAGSYQRRNIVTAAATVDFLHEETPLTISRRAFMEGTRHAAANTSLCGRWQRIAEAPLTLCDTGHNAHGMAYVAEQLKTVPHDKLYCVMGFVRDKDLAHILPLLPRDAHYIFTAAQSHRALPAAELAAKAAIYGLQGETAENVAAALARARELATPEDAIFVGGSTYVVAEALE